MTEIWLLTIDLGIGFCMSAIEFENMKFAFSYRNNKCCSIVCNGQISWSLDRIFESIVHYFLQNIINFGLKSLEPNISIRLWLTFTSAIHIGVPCSSATMICWPLQDKKIQFPHPSETIPAIWSNVSGSKISYLIFINVMLELIVYEYLYRPCHHRKI